jgi:hypothetical protein
MSVIARDFVRVMLAKNLSHLAAELLVRDRRWLLAAPLRLSSLRFRAFFTHRSQLRSSRASGNPGPLASSPSLWVPASRGDERRLEHSTALNNNFDRAADRKAEVAVGAAAINGDFGKAVHTKTPRWAADR